MSGKCTITLPVEDVRLLHHAAAVTVQVYDAAEQESGVPAHAPLYGKRDRLLQLARQLDHEANCNRPPPNTERNAPLNGCRFGFHRYGSWAWTGSVDTGRWPPTATQSRACSDCGKRQGPLVSSEERRYYESWRDR